MNLYGNHTSNPIQGTYIALLTTTHEPPRNVQIYS